MHFDAVILAGGSSRRLGGADKARLEIGGIPLLERVLAAASGARRVIVVGPRRSTGHEVVWAEESPPGGGPVAALAAGLERVDGPVVAVLAVDYPFVSPGLVSELLDARGDADGALARDEGGRDQPLLAAYLAGALRARLETLPAVRDAPLRALLEGLDLVRVPAGPAALDCDTWEAVEEARRRAPPPP